jgi:hypothetical protein
VHWYTSVGLSSASGTVFLNPSFAAKISTFSQPSTWLWLVLLVNQPVHLHGLTTPNLI